MRNIWKEGINSRLLVFLAGGLYALFVAREAT